MSAYKIFLIKLLVFLAPILFFLGLTLYPLFSEPIDQDTTRSWEALSVLEKNDILRGPFYPYMHFRKIEKGDTPHPQQLAVPKDVIWETDRYGYRKKEIGKDSFDIVVIGDSQTAGSTLTQDDILTEQLERKLGVSVYPFAPSNIIKYTQDSRFQKYPPKIVILTSAEKLFFNLPEVPTQKSYASIFDTFWEPVRLNKGVIGTATIADRLKKKSFMEYFHNDIRELPERFRMWAFKITKMPPNLGSEINLALDGSMAFSVQSDDYFIDIKEREMYWQIQKMLGYKKYLESKGTRFLIVIIPNKENIYHDLVVRGKKPEAIPYFLDEAEKAGLEVVDLQTVFEGAHKKNPRKYLYHIDDGHWNPYGVGLASEEVASAVRKILE